MPGSLLATEASENFYVVIQSGSSAEQYLPGSTSPLTIQPLRSMYLTDSPRRKKMIGVATMYLLDFRIAQSGL